MNVNYVPVKVISLRFWLKKVKNKRSFKMISVIYIGTNTKKDTDYSNCNPHTSKDEITVVTNDTSILLHIITPLPKYYQRYNSFVSPTDRTRHFWLRQCSAQFVGHKSGILTLASKLNKIVRVISLVRTCYCVRLDCVSWLFLEANTLKSTLLIISGIMITYKMLKKVKFFWDVSV